MLRTLLLVVTLHMACCNILTGVQVGQKTVTTTKFLLLEYAVAVIWRWFFCQGIWLHWWRRT